MERRALLSLLAGVAAAGCNTTWGRPEHRAVTVANDTDVARTVAVVLSEPGGDGGSGVDYFDRELDLAPNARTTVDEAMSFGDDIPYELSVQVRVDGVRVVDGTCPAPNERVVIVVEGDEAVNVDVDPET